LSDILVRSVAFTGDTDTVATIAVAAGSMHPDIPNDLHDDLYRNIEGGKYGWRYLKALDAKLMKAFPLVVPKKAPSTEPEANIIEDLFGG
jgi:hypothetical protein